MTALKSFLSRWPELKWGLSALLAWWLLGFLLAPFTATYGPEFLHKAVVTVARMMFAISLTELAVRICFPTIREWLRDGGFRKGWEAMQTDDENSLSALPQIVLTTVVHLVIFAAVLISLSL